MDMLFSHGNIMQLLQQIGYAGMFAIAFLESGVIIGAILPGDSMLFISGLLSAHGYFKLPVLLMVFVSAGILGEVFGYYFGKYVGHALYRWEDGIIFKKRYLATTHEFYEKYGARAVFFGRFMPVVRTLVPILAGVAEMRFSTFMTYNVLGALVWGGGIPLLGYLLGDKVPGAENYLLPIIVLIVGLSLLPALIEFVRSRGKNKT